MSVGTVQMRVAHRRVSFFCHTNTRELAQMAFKPHSAPPDKLQKMKMFFPSRVLRGMDGFFWHNYIQFVHSTCLISLSFFDCDLDRGSRIIFSSETKFNFIDRSFSLFFSVFLNFILEYYVFIIQLYLKAEKISGEFLN